MITDPPPQFDLVEQPWIPCTMLDGSVKELSLRGVFERSRQIRRISGELPTQDYALLRVLLVIFWRAHRDDPGLVGPGADVDEWWEDAFDAAGGETQVQRIRIYLEQWRHRFDLFDAAAPFMQVADLHTKKGEHSGVEKILVDSRSDYLSMRAGSSLNAIQFPEVGRWLVHVHAWDYGGNKTGVEGDPRVKNGKVNAKGPGWAGSTGGVVLHGRTLAETLVLNTVPLAVFGEREEPDLPAWEQDPHTAAPRGVEFPTGPCDVLTWQSRRVRLFPDGERVTGVLVASGERIERKNQFADPMTAYSYSPDQSSRASTVHTPQQHDAARTLWRGLAPLLVREGAWESGSQETRLRQPSTVAWLHAVGSRKLLPDDLLVDVELVGMRYGTQSSVVVDTVHETLALRLGILMSKDPRMAKAILDAGRATMDAARDFGWYAAHLLLAAGWKWKKRPSEAFQPSLEEKVFHRLDAPFKDWLLEVDEGSDPVAQRERWFDIVERVVLEEAAVLQQGAGPQAVIGRLISGVQEEPNLVSAATAMTHLRRSLRKHLPRERLTAGGTANPVAEPTKGEDQ